MIVGIIQELSQSCWGSCCKCYVKKCAPKQVSVMLEACMGGAKSRKARENRSWLAGGKVNRMLLFVFSVFLFQSTLQFHS